MIEECLNFILFLCGTLKPSGLSAIYLAFGIAIWLILLLTVQVPRAVYKYLGISSVLLNLWKLVMLIIFYSDKNSTFFSDHKETLKILGVFYHNTSELNYVSAASFYPDLMAFLVSLIGYYYGNTKLKLSNNFRRMLNLFLTFSMVMASCISSFSFVNVLYIIIAMYWVLTWSYGIYPRLYQLGCRVISFVTVIQILTSYLYNMVLHNYFSSVDAIRYGIILPTYSDYFNFLVVFALHGFSTVYARRALLNPDEHRAVLIQPEEEIKDNEEKNFNSTLDDEDLNDSVPFELSRSLLQAPKPSLEEFSRASQIPEVLQPPSPPKKKMKISKIPLQIIKFIYAVIFSFSFLYLVARFLLFLWIFHYMSILGCFEMLWLFYSLIDDDDSRTIKTVRYILCPMLVIQFFTTYVLNIFDINPNSQYGFPKLVFPALDVGFQLLTIFLFLYLTRSIRKMIKKQAKTDGNSSWEMLLTIVLQNADKFSISVLFVVGLSAINLVHTGFMIICLFFMLNFNLAKKFWIVLVIYTMTVLFIRYLWLLILSLINKDSLNETLLDFIGLPIENNAKDDKVNILPYDFLVWVLLFSAAMQLRAYKATMFSLVYHQFTREEFAKNHPLIMKSIMKMYRWYYKVEMWAIYLFIFLLFLIAKLNWLNFARMVLGCGYLLIHLYGNLNEISKNYMKVKSIWPIIVYYSGILLVTRYVYQFIPFIKAIKHYNFSFIGLEVYSSSDLYESMVTDCLLLIFTVLGSRSHKKDDVKFRPSTSDQFEDVGLIQGLIQANMSIIEQDIGQNSYFKFIHPWFQLIIFLAISILASQWKLSISMGAYIAIIEIYYFFNTLYMSEYIQKKSSLDSEKEYWYRSLLWTALFIATLCNLILSYLGFIINKDFMGDNSDNILWFYVWIGYEKPDESFLIKNCYGYLILLIFLVIERHCLEFILFEKVLLSDEEKLQAKKSKILVKFLNFLRVLAEALVPMFILLIAFSKLTFVSVIYVIGVFLSILLGTTFTRTKFLNYLLLTMTLVQYALLVGNLQNKNSPTSLPADSPINVPWYLHKTWENDDVPVFFGLGTSIGQLHSIIWDLLTLLFLYIYYTFLSAKENELEMLGDEEEVVDLSSSEKSHRQSEKEKSEESKSDEEEEKIEVEKLDIFKDSHSLEKIEEAKDTSLESSSSNSSTGSIDRFLEESKQQHSRVPSAAPARSETSHHSLPQSLPQTFSNAPEINRNSEEIPFGTFDTAKFDTVKPEPSKFNKEILLKFKSAFYNSSHFLILPIVLLFISQSHGLISGVYCLFCLIFIYKSNEIIKSEKSWNQYLKILRNYFLIFMLIDLTLQIIYQLPVEQMHSSSTATDWVESAGLMQLWTAGGNNPDDVDNKQLKINFKIFTFAFLYMMYRMMKSKDFTEHMKKQRQSLLEESRKIGLEIAHHFNDKRIEENKSYQEKRKRFENELLKLDQNVNKWSKKFYGGNESKKSSIGYMLRQRDRRFTSKIRFSRASGIGQPSSSAAPLEAVATEQKESFKIRFQNLLINLINPVIFKNYIKKLKEHEKKNISQDVTPIKIEEIRFPDSSPMGEQDELEEEVNLKDDLPKQRAEYDLTWKNYIVLIAYAIASNTEYLVILFFFVNHFVYASLESAVFPLSVLGYAMLEYPRPPARYFRYMLLYTIIVFFIKYCLQFQLWGYVFANLDKYEDTYKIGFNLASNTYSQNLFVYIFWDVVVMLLLIFHEYYLLRVGLWPHTEFDLESLKEAKKRKLLEMANEETVEQSQIQIRPFKEPQRSLYQKIRAFYGRILPRNKEEKPGWDLYTPTVLAQLLIFLYILCFFSDMDGQSTNISRSFVANQFSGRMVIALILQMAAIIFERFLYLTRTSQALKLALLRLSNVKNEEICQIQWDRPLQIKLLWHILLLLTIHWLVFWYFPLYGNYMMVGEYNCQSKYDNERCNNFQINYSLEGFYVLYMIYFIIASLQIQHGLPSFRTGSFPLQRNVSSGSRYGFLLYRALPFIFELRTLIDWTATKTSLDIFQWFKFENIYARLYVTQVSQRWYGSHVRGQPIKKGNKIANGCIVLIFLLCIILMPLLIFSSLNPIIESNGVKSLSVEIGTIVDDNNYFRLYLASRVSDMHYITTKEWNENKFNKLRTIQAADKDLMQIIVMPTSADTEWNMTPPSQQQLCNSLADALGPKKTTIELQITYTFVRKYPQTVQRISEEVSYPLSIEQILDLNSVICLGFTNSFSYEKFDRIIYRLPSAGSSISPDPIEATNSVPYDLVMNLNKTDTNGLFWEVGFLDSAKNFVGMNIVTISENYSPVAFGFSVITFYVSVVWLLGRIIRATLASGGSTGVLLTDMPDPEPLINLCSGVYLSRMTGDLLREEELYYELIDILRSPEVTKMLTGRSSIKEKSD
ncbi:PIEZO2_4 [Blepharisma stoltei]|uniref:Piezo-type mechanosensitive ion channel component n=1 Tax=Blepharisma stoltei TaxID=1481888 RepID=A0AAU9IYC7_9CILI|nr:unnamed protein product [Blepharisma stoltei]